MSSERVIVVGAGGIANAWFPGIVKEQLQVAAVVDLKLEAAQKRIDDFHLEGAAASDDLDKTLRDVRADFLIDLTIPDAHCDITCKALQAGLHVIGEKPMASTMEHAKRMVRASEESGRLYMVSQSRRWDTKHATIARAVASGTIGRLTSMHCDFFLAAHFGGFRDEMTSPLFLDMAIHHFDLARMLGRVDATSVYAEEFNPVGSWYKGDVNGHCLFSLSDNVRFTYRGSWCSEGCHTGWNGDWRLIGTKGTIVYHADHTIRCEVVASDEGFVRPKQTIILPEVPVDPGGMHGGLREMLRFLRTGAKPQTECHDNIKSLAMVHAAIASARSGRREDVPA